MKKVFTLLLVLIGATLLFSGCSQEAENTVDDLKVESDESTNVVEEAQSNDEIVEENLETEIISEDDNVEIGELI